MTEIGEYAFWDCTNLAEVTMTDGVRNIGRGAFAGCESLTEMAIPDSVTKMGAAIVENCFSLEKLTVHGYTVDAQEWNRMARPTDALTMLRNRDYGIKLLPSVKYPLVSQVFLKEQQPEAEAFLKKNIQKILPYFIDRGEYDTVKGLLESGKFVAKRNILKFIDRAKQ